MLRISISRCLKKYCTGCRMVFAISLSRCSRSCARSSLTSLRSNFFKLQDTGSGGLTSSPHLLSLSIGALLIVD